MGCGSSSSATAVEEEGNGAIIARQRSKQQRYQQQHGETSVNGAGVTPDSDALPPTGVKRAWSPKNSTATGDPSEGGDRQTSSTRPISTDPQSTIIAAQSQVVESVDLDALDPAWLKAARESSGEMRRMADARSTAEKASDLYEDGTVQNAAMALTALAVRSAPFPCASAVADLLDGFRSLYEASRTKKQWTSEFMQYLTRVDKDVLESLNVFASEMKTTMAPTHGSNASAGSIDLTRIPPPQAVRDFLVPLESQLRSAQRVFATIVGREGLESFFLAVHDEESLHEERSKIEQLKSEATSSMLSSIKSDTKEILSFLKATQKEEEDRRQKRELLRQLSPMDLQDDLQTELQRFMPGTRMEVIKTISEWIEQRPPTTPDEKLPSSQRLLLFHGSAGTGKSTVAAVIFQKYYQDALVIHICQHSLSNRRDPHRILRNLVHQLMTLIPEYREYLIAKLAAQAPLDTFSTPDLWSELLSKPFTEDIGWTWWKRPHKCVLLIDAFDESEADGRNALLKLLDYHKGQTRQLPNWMSIIVTARTESVKNDYRTAFPPVQAHDADSGYSHVELHRDVADLEHFLRFALTLKAPARIDIKKAEMPKAVKVLASKCGGLFLQAQLTLKRYAVDTDHIGPLSRVAIARITNASTSGSDSNAHLQVDPLLLRTMVAANAAAAATSSSDGVASSLSLSNKSSLLPRSNEREFLTMAAIETASESLADFYAESVGRVFQQYDRSADLSRLLQVPKDALLPLAMSAIELVSVAQEPMSIAVLSQALHLKRPFHFLHLHGPFGVLFPVSGDTSKGMQELTVGVFHKSVLDFLASEARLEHGSTAAIFIERAHAHGRLADLCYQTMLRSTPMALQPVGLGAGASAHSHALRNQPASISKLGLPPILDVMDVAATGSSSLLRYAILWGPLHAIVADDVRLAACFLCHPQYLMARALLGSTASLGSEYAKALALLEQADKFDSVKLRTRRSIEDHDLWLTLKEASLALPAFQRFFRTDVRTWAAEPELVIQCALVWPPSSPVARAASHLIPWFTSWPGRTHQLVEWSNRPTQLSSLVDVLRGPPTFVTTLASPSVPGDLRSWLRSTPEHESTWIVIDSRGMLSNKYVGRSQEFDGIVSATVAADSTVFLGDAFGQIRCLKWMDSPIIAHIQSRLQSPLQSAQGPPTSSSTLQSSKSSTSATGAAMPVEDNATIIAIATTAFGGTHYIIVALAVSNGGENASVTYQLHCWSKTQVVILPRGRYSYTPTLREDKSPHAIYCGRLAAAIPTTTRLTCMVFAHGGKQLLLGFQDGSLHCLALDLNSFEIERIEKIAADSTTLPSVTNPLARGLSKQMSNMYVGSVMGSPQRSVYNPSYNSRGGLHIFSPSTPSPSMNEELVSDESAAHIGGGIPCESILCRPAMCESAVHCIAVRSRVKPAEMAPAVLVDPYHPQHLLQRQSDLPDFVCDWCKQPGSKDGYKCVHDECQPQQQPNATEDKPVAPSEVSSYDRRERQGMASAETTPAIGFVGHLHCARPDLYMVEWDSMDSGIKGTIDPRKMEAGNQEFALAQGNIISVYAMSSTNVWQRKKQYHTDTPVLCLAYSPERDGSRLASGELGQWIRVYDTRFDVKQCVWSYRATAPVGCITWLTPDSILFSVNGGVAKVSTKSGLSSRVPRRDDEETLQTCCQFAPRSAYRRHDTASVDDGSIMSGTTVAVNSGETDIAMAVGSYTGALRSINSESGQTRSEHAPSVFTGQGRVNQIDFSPDAKCFASVGWDRRLRLWKLETGRCFFRSAELDGELGWVKYHLDLNRPYLACGTILGKMYVWSLLESGIPQLRFTLQHTCERSVGIFDARSDRLICNGRAFKGKPMLVIQHPGSDAESRTFCLEPSISDQRCDLCRSKFSGLGYVWRMGNTAISGNNSSSANISSATSNSAAAPSVLYMHPQCADHCAGYQYTASVIIPTVDPHPLTYQATLIRGAQSGKCDLCMSALTQGFFSCVQCKSPPLCSVCVRFLGLFPRKVPPLPDKGCKHESLVLVHKPNGAPSHSCDVCRESMRDIRWQYRCDDDDFDAHTECVSQPDAVLNSYSLTSDDLSNEPRTPTVTVVGKGSVDSICQSSDGAWMIIGVRSNQGQLLVQERNQKTGDFADKHAIPVDGRVMTTAFSETRSLSIRYSSMTRRPMEQAVTLLAAAVDTGSNCSIRIYMVGSWQLLQTLAGHPQSITSLSFHPTDILRIASAGTDNVTRIWEISDTQINQAAQALSSGSVLHVDGYEFQRRLILKQPENGESLQTNERGYGSRNQRSSVHPRGVIASRVHEDRDGNLLLVSCGPFEVVQWSRPPANNAMTPVTGASQSSGPPTSSSAAISSIANRRDPRTRESPGDAAAAMQLLPTRLEDRNGYVSKRITDCLVDMKGRKVFVVSGDGVSRYSLDTNQLDQIWISHKLSLENARMCFMPPVAIRATNSEHPDFAERCVKMDETRRKVIMSVRRVIHPNVSCSSCYIAIEGYRFRCVTCAQSSVRSKPIQLCEKCVFAQDELTNTSHATHTFTRTLLTPQEESKDAEAKAAAAAASSASSNADVKSSTVNPNSPTGPSKENVTGLLTTQSSNINSSTESKVSVPSNSSAKTAAAAVAAAAERVKPVAKSVMPSESESEIQVDYAADGPAPAWFFSRPKCVRKSPVLSADEIISASSLDPLPWTVRTTASALKSLILSLLVVYAWRGGKTSAVTASVASTLSFLTHVEVELSKMFSAQLLESRNSTIMALIAQLEEQLKQLDAVLLQVTGVSEQLAALLALTHFSRLADVRKSISKCIYDLLSNALWHAEQQATQASTSSAPPRTTTTTSTEHVAKLHESLTAWRQLQLHENQPSKDLSDDRVLQAAKSEYYAAYLKQRMQLLNKYVRGSRDDALSEVKSWLITSPQTVANDPSVGLQARSKQPPLTSNKLDRQDSAVLAPIPNLSDAPGSSVEDDKPLTSSERIFLFEGPKGCGKSILAAQICEEIGGGSVTCLHSRDSPSLYYQNTSDHLQVQLSILVPAFRTYRARALRQQESRWSYDDGNEKVEEPRQTTSIAPPEVRDMLQRLSSSSLLKAIVTPFATELTSVFSRAKPLVIVLDEVSFKHEFRFLLDDAILSVCPTWLRFVVFVQTDIAGLYPSIPRSSFDGLLSRSKLFRLAEPVFDVRYLLIGANPDQSESLTGVEGRSAKHIHVVDCEVSAGQPGPPSTRLELKTVVSLGTEGAGVRAMDTASFSNDKLDTEVHLLATSSSGSGEYIQIFNLATQLPYSGLQILISEAKEEREAAQRERDRESRVRRGLPPVVARATPTVVVSTMTIGQRMMAHLMQQPDSQQPSSNDVKWLAIPKEKQTPFLLSADQDLRIRLWDVEKCICLQQFSGHEDSIDQLAIHPSAAYFVSGSSDLTARIWCLKTGLQVGCLRVHHDAVKLAGFCDDGQNLITASSDRLIAYWQLGGQLAGDRKLILDEKLSESTAGVIQLLCR